MAESITTARPYAEAAFRLAKESDALARWSQMLELLAQVVGDEQVAAAIDDPNVERQRLQNLIFEVAGDGFDDRARNFVELLLENNRLSQVSEIRGLFEQIKREDEGVLEAAIYSAFALDESQRAELVAQLERKHNRSVRATVIVEPELIGGVKIVIGDKVFDASVRASLDAMSTALSH